MTLFFDILLVALVLSVMIMLLMGVNQLMEHPNPNHEEMSRLKKEIDEGCDRISQGGVFSSFLIREDSGNLHSESSVKH